MTDFDPQKIDSFVKVLSAMNAIHPWIGTTVALIGIITSVAVFINNWRTKINTAAQVNTTKALNEQVAAIKNAEKQALNTLDAKIEEIITITGEYHKAKCEMMIEIKKTTVGMMRLYEEGKKHLSMVPTIQAAISRMEARLERSELERRKNESKLDSLIDGLERLRKR